MDPLIDARLKALEQKVDEVAGTVRKIRRAQQTASIIRFAYWAIIILAGIGAFYAIEPYIEQLKGAYGFMNTSSENQYSLIDQLRQFQEDNL